MSAVRRSLLVLLAIAFAAPSLRGEDRVEGAGRAGRWSPRAVELFGSLPVQDGGRIKPASTFAGFTLLRLHGTRRIESADGARLEPVAWLLDVIFFPEEAARAQLFLVQDSDAITAIGLATGAKRKRDRWSYEELQPGLPKLFDLAHDYDAIPEKERDSVQQQVVLLAGNVMSFLCLARELDGLHEDAQPHDRGLLALVPPAGPNAEWRTAADVVMSSAPDAEDAAVLASLRKLVHDRSDTAAFERELGSLHERLVARANARGEYGKIALERFYYRSNTILWSLVAFLAAFLVASVLWLRPTSRVLHRLTFACASAGVALLVAAIVMRCCIRARPPVSTLYESVLFVTAVGGAIALFLEAIHKNRIGVSAAALLGAIGLFIANGYETLDKQDTMPSLVAVLDTNFWLATHVTAITIGYSAGLLAALLGSAYLLTRVIRWKRADPTVHRSLARMVYGVLCFAVIFATVGTILGGIWANESWGRFWGWDPKENGALLIVITQVGILHGRMTGALRDRGLCMAAAFGGSVIAFSWWGVNLLGVGLHSYGFTSGVHRTLWTYYFVQWGIVALGAVSAWRERARAAQPEPAASELATGAIRAQDAHSDRSNTKAAGRAA